jgi:predicted lysophospholipase L1 biosynthesis ABC-type transport system permease subunit
MRSTSSTCWSASWHSHPGCRWRGAVASILVLAGALAAGNRARIHDAVVLKTLGATRSTLIRAFCYEYAMLGLSTAIFALFAGGVAAWFVVSKIMSLPSSFLPDVALITMAVALSSRSVSAWPAPGGCSGRRPHPSCASSEQPVNR